MGAFRRLHLLCFVLVHVVAQTRFGSWPAWNSRVSPVSSVAWPGTTSSLSFARPSRPFSTFSRPVSSSFTRPVASSSIASRLVSTPVRAWPTVTSTATATTAATATTTAATATSTAATATTTVPQAPPIPAPPTPSNFEIIAKALAAAEKEALDKIKAFYSTAEDEDGVRFVAETEIDYTGKLEAVGTVGDPTAKDEEEKKKKKKKKKKEKTPGAEYVWDPSQLRAYNLIMNTGDLRKLEAAPAAETYVQCSVQTDFNTPQQQLYENAGCRFKGSVGSLRICLDPLTGRLKPGSCRKLSWKVNANKFVPKGEKQEIFNQDKLVFNGLAVDYSLLSERLAYTMINQAGIQGPLASHAIIYVNGRYDGVYSIVEAPDDEFTKRVWKSDENKGEGGLYKDVLIGHSVDPEYFAKHHQSGKKEEDFLVEVSQAMMDADPAEYPDVLDKYFDVESVEKVTAINMLLGATDDWRMRHNFFWYVHETEDPNAPEPPPDTVSSSDTEDTESDKKKKKKKKKKKAKKPTVKKLKMVPWDYDRINDKNADKRGAAGALPHWYDYMPPNDLSCLAPTKPATAKAQERSQGSPQVYTFWMAIFETLPENVDTPINCDLYTRVLASIKDRVLARVQLLGNTIVTAANIDALMATYKAQISSAVQRDPDPPAYNEWQTSMTALRTYLLESRRANLNPTPYVPGTGGFGTMDPEFLRILGVSAQEVANLMAGGEVSGLVTLTQNLSPLVRQRLQRYEATGKTGFLTGPLAPGNEKYLQELLLKAQANMLEDAGAPQVGGAAQPAFGAGRGTAFGAVNMRPVGMPMGVRGGGRFGR